MRLISVCKSLMTKSGARKIYFDTQGNTYGYSAVAITQRSGYRPKARYRRGNAPVAERGLDKPKVGGLLKEPCCEGMAKDVGMKPIAQSRLRGPLGEPSLDMAHSYAAASIVKERGGGIGGLAASPPQVGLKVVQCLSTEVTRLVMAAPMKLSGTATTRPLINPSSPRGIAEAISRTVIDLDEGTATT